MFSIFRNWAKNTQDSRLFDCGQLSVSGKLPHFFEVQTHLEIRGVFDVHKLFMNTICKQVRLASMNVCTTLMSK